ncbi:MAG: histidinol dehydrogenase [Janthinobacterium lividum]
MVSVTSPEGFAGSVRYVKAPERSSSSDTADVVELVTEILGAVRKRGDVALREYSRRFDQAEIEQFEVSAQSRQSAVDAMDSQTRNDTEFAIENVRRFAEAQLATILPLEIEALPGLHLGHRVIPIQRVGAYVPGGRFPLLSAPIMTIVPGKVAGCDEVIACLPPNAHPAMIAGCHLSGADRIFRVGGAQAIAAMAYGTESVPQVNKIVGPGNAFVNEAKRQVFGPVGIDQLAGPSEIFVVADGTGDAELIATDLLAQAEHDVRTRVGLITTDAALATATAAEVLRQLEKLATGKIASESWTNYGEITVCDDEAAMIRYSDYVAAEHLQIHTADPHALAKKLRNYGSLFIGENASVVFSDKCVGTNHTLPTMSAGRYTGGLWVGSYVKIATHQWLEDRAIHLVGPPAIRQSGSEGLDGHQKAAALRHQRQAATFAALTR